MTFTLSGGNKTTVVFHTSCTSYKKNGARKFVFMSYDKVCSIHFGWSMLLYQFYKKYSKIIF